MHGTIIGESELIINPRGAIYHLNIAPLQLAPTIITVGDPNRVQQVSKYFDQVTHKAQHREFITHTGTLSGKPVTVVSTGIGPDNIDIVLNELDALVNIDFETRTIKDHKTELTIIRLGTCGGLQPDLPMNSLIVSSHGIGLDNLLHYYNHTNSSEENFLLHEFIKHTSLNSKNIIPYIAAASSSLKQIFTDGFIHGITVTCPGFYAPQGRTLRLPPAFPTLLDSLTTFNSNGARTVNFEMETASLYGLGKLLGHKCLSISVIVANRISRSFSKNAANAIENMIRKSLEIIAQM